MTVTIHDAFKAAPRISESKFVQVLESVRSFEAKPLWGVTRSAREAAARDIYRLIDKEGHDPAVWLAIAGKEHTFGTNPSSVLWRNNTKSWTNARTVRHPEVKQRATVIRDSDRGSNYVKYETLFDSVLDGLYRVDEPGFAYRKANAVSIVDHIRIWAPGSDNNKPDAYAQTMCDWISGWIATDTGDTPQPPKEATPMGALPIRVDHIPPGQPNRPSVGMDPAWITVHETSNYRAGANAEMHRRFVNSGGGAGNVSWHYTVDDSEIVQHLPLNEHGWHAGDGGNGTGNRKSIGIEMCVNADGDFVKTRALAARLVACLMDDYNIPISRVVQHNHWSGKNCPLITRRDNLWPSFLDAVKVAQDGPREPQDSEPAPHPSARHFSETGQYIAQGFRDHWEQFGDDSVSIRVFGYPLTGELKDGELTVQYFERAVFEWHPGTGVLLRRLGAEELERAA